MKLVMGVMPVLLIITVLVFFLTGSQSFNYTFVEEWFKNLEDPLVDYEGFKGLDFGNSWFFNFIEVPVNAVVYIGDFIVKVVVAVINSVWAITQLWL